MQASINSVASDWFMAADQMRLDAAKGTATATFKIGSMSLNQAALIACSGAVSGNQVPDLINYDLPASSARIFGAAFSLASLHGRKGNAMQGFFGFTNGAPFLQANAFRRTGKDLFTTIFDLEDTSDFAIRGQWILRSVLVLSDTFQI